MPPRQAGRERGAMLITMSLFFITLLGFAALAFDVGHLMIVRNELQNAADAAALAGANCLDRTTAVSGSDCTSSVSPSLNWTIAGIKASDAIGLNKSDGVALFNGTVATGYKNLGGTPPGLQAATLSPVGPDDKPAVMVSLSRAIGNNGGPVQTLIAAMYGGAAAPIAVDAVAVLTSPGNVLTGSLIPQAINKCMFDLYWDQTSNSPHLATSASLNGVPQVIGQAWELRIGSTTHYPDCDSGQWTSFAIDANDAPTVSTLIASGNPTSLGLGENIWIEPDTNTALYGNLSAQYPTPPGADVILAVVDRANGLNNKGQTPIVGFAGFHIDDIQGGSDKYLQGHFIKAAIASGASGTGPFYGTYTPARLAQ